MWVWVCVLVSHLYVYHLYDRNSDACAYIQVGLT